MESKYLSGGTSSSTNNSSSSSVGMGISSGSSTTKNSGSSGTSNVLVNSSNASLADYFRSQKQQKATGGGLTYVNEAKLYTAQMLASEKALLVMACKRMPFTQEFPEDYKKLYNDITTDANFKDSGPTRRYKDECDKIRALAKKYNVPVATKMSWDAIIRSMDVDMKKLWEDVTKDNMVHNVMLFYSKGLYINITYAQIATVFATQSKFIGGSFVFGPDTATKTRAEYAQLLLAKGKDVVKQALLDSKINPAYLAVPNALMITETAEFKRKDATAINGFVEAFKWSCNFFTDTMLNDNVKDPLSFKAESKKSDARWLSFFKSQKALRAYLALLRDPDSWGRDPKGKNGVKNTMTISLY